MQKTTFPIEILIHDDASTDGTEEIIREYEALYPHTIKPLYETENQWNNGRRGSRTFNWPRARGKYIALCEGDDYWTDPLKLQKQVEFLENNPDCSLCFHASKNEWATDPSKFLIYRPVKLPGDNKFEMKDAILGGGGFMATNSMVFLRRHIENRLEWMDKTPAGDLSLMLLLASKGKIGYLDEVMSVYRIMVPNSWSYRKTGYSLMARIDIIRLNTKLFQNFDAYTNNQYSLYFLRKIITIWFRIPLTAAKIIFRKFKMGKWKNQMTCLYY
jgi:glycosyltransferase involved in cell wall biosynthesis